MHNTDKQALEQAKAQQNPIPSNGQPRPTTQQPSEGTKPIPTPITVVAAKLIADQNQNQFNDLVIGYLVQGFFDSQFNGLGAIGQAIADEGSLAMPLTLPEFRSTQPPSLPPGI